MIPEDHRVKSTPMKRAVVAAVVLLLAGAALWFFLRHKKPPAPRWETSKVTRGNIVARVTATGTLSALVTVQVGSQVSGRISQINVDFNSPVKKGQVVARIDPQLFARRASRTARPTSPPPRGSWRRPRPTPRTSTCSAAQPQAARAEPRRAGRSRHRRGRRRRGAGQRRRCKRGSWRRRARSCTRRRSTSTTRRSSRRSTAWSSRATSTSGRRWPRRCRRRRCSPSPRT